MAEKKPDSRAVFPQRGVNEAGGGKRGPEADDSLRSRAEQRMQIVKGINGSQGFSDERLRHELNVHQIELELQNEELMRSHAELQTARDYLESLFHNSPVAFVTLDESNVVCDANAAADELLAFPKGVSGVDLLRFISPRHQALARQTIERSLRRGKPQSCELEYSPFEGTRARWLKLHCSGLPEVYGRAGSICLCVLEDVTSAKNFEQNLVLAKNAVEVEVRKRTTELQDVVKQLTREVEVRRRAELAWQDSERRYRALVEQLPAVVYISEPTAPRNFIYLSARIETMTGYRPEELEGAPLQWRKTVHEDDRERIHAALMHCIETREPFAEQYRIVARDGSVLWLQDRSSMIVGEDGRARLQGILFDVTEKKKLEEALIAAKIKAESANRAKSEFLANMSHEVRTPLNGVLGMLQLMQMSDPCEEIQEFLDLAMLSGRSLMTVINDILDFSKVEAGRLDLRIAPFSLRELVNGVLGMFREQASAKGVSLRLKLDEDVPAQVLGDDARLRQILFNLLGNAVKFTEQGEVALLIDALPSPEKSGELLTRIIVRDTGVGIPQEKLESIFEPFTQIDSSSTRRYQGTGLGLGIVRRLVELMQGRVQVQSSLGKGSAFTILLPLRAMEDAEAVPPLEERVADSGTLSVLLADDNPVSLVAASGLLRRLGHTVTTVENGVQVLEELARHSYDCLLLDIQMPELDGVEVARLIRNGEAPGVDPKLHIIALTAHAMSGDKERFLAQGMDDYIAKPVELAELEAVLARTPRGTADSLAG